MALGDVLVHSAYVLRPVQSGARIEGEHDVEDEEGTPFDCFLILPRGGQESNAPRGRRTITRPTLLYEPEDQLNGVVELDSTSKLMVTAEELTGPDPVEWQVDGDPTPFARPGELIGFEVNLKRVSD